MNIGDVVVVAIMAYVLIAVIVSLVVNRKLLSAGIDPLELDLVTIATCIALIFVWPVSKRRLLRILDPLSPGGATGMPTRDEM